MSLLRVLHVIGSAESQFFYDLSCVYAGDCLSALADAPGCEHIIALISPEGSWSFPRSLDEKDRSVATEMSEKSALQILNDALPDVAIPQMFCNTGMTRYRSLLDLLGIPYVGNRPELMKLTLDKTRTKNLVKHAGVLTPAGQTCGPSETPLVSFPCVVKPCTSDNSLGVSLVRRQSELSAALTEGFKHSERVLVEDFIELGREVRCGILQQGDQLICLPLQEYQVDPQVPIRRYENKLTSIDGKLDLTSKHRPQSWIVPTDDPDVPAVWEAAKRCHRGLSCRDYSLFDFRIDKQGQPWFLEAGLYCSFAPNSILTSMVEATGVELETFFRQMLERAISRESNSLQATMDRGKHLSIHQ